jgi:hypothetical protein
MDKIFNLALGRGYLLKSTMIKDETIYWVENLYFTSEPYSCLEDLVSFLHTLPLLPNSEDTLTWMNLVKALSSQSVDAIAS